MRGLNPLAVQHKIKYHLPLTDHRPKLAILVSAYDHCLGDLPSRHGIVELGCDIVTIISNYDKAKATGRLLWDSHLLSSPHDKRKCEREIKDWIGQDIDPIVPA